MNRILLVIMALCLSFQADANSRNLQALFSYKTFYSPESGPYIETYLSVNAQTVMYLRNSSGRFQGAIQIEMTFNDASGVAHQDKYNLLSPEVPDTGNIQFNFLDQQRIQLRNGTYNLKLTITDKNVGTKSYSVSENFKLEYYDNIAAISDIQFLESYTKSTSESPTVITKSGYDLVPYVDNFYSANKNVLKFYAEVYNANKVLMDQSYLLSYFIETSESHQQVEKFQGFSRVSPERVSSVIREIPISDLPSGNYNIVIEMRNQQNELLASRSAFFQQSNKIKVPVGANDYTQIDVSNTFVSHITDKDSLIDYINSLHPISSSLERTFLTNQMKLADVKIMQQFFYDFWSKRSPVNPEKAWIDYHQEVWKVNSEFSTRIAPGYATERGRVYLKYGPPNTMNQHYAEPSAYPYEIWHYYKLGTQSNRKFVFYNPDLVTNDFQLLHSDAQGEISNARWQMVVFKRDTQSINFDDEKKSGDYFGNQVNENFTNPK